MTDAEIRKYLRAHGYAAHIVSEGRAGLIRRWKEFVEEVERGYPFGIEDYRNDLDVRGIIAALKLDSEVHDLDQRFKRLLTATNLKVWETGGGGGFWEYGYPRNAGEDLMADLRSEGLMEGA